MNAQKDRKDKKRRTVRLIVHFSGLCNYERGPPLGGGKDPHNRERSPPHLKKTYFRRDAIVSSKWRSPTGRTINISTVPTVTV